ncbi:MAG: AraC family transcriptional regulator [Myxococcota bacterium]|nr:AraC family transcriptional regulator [Myxococcota bacterium]
MALAGFTAVPDVTTLVAAPGDAVIVRRSFCLWQSHRRAHGTILWGRPDEDDVAELCAIWDEHLRTPFGADPTVADVRAVQSVDLLAFERLSRTFVERRAEWTARTGPQAIVHRFGLAGASILGMLQLVGQGYRLRAFDVVGEAFEWLERSEVLASYEALRIALLGEADVVRRLHAVLEAEPRLGTAELARRLGLSVRSLQRHLAMAGTSLRAERARHVVRHAERLLEGTELDLDAIAASIGLASSSRLVALFRRVHRVTPGAFRRERRSAMRS